MLLNNLLSSRKYFDDLDQREVRNLGNGPNKSVIRSKWSSSQLSMFRRPILATGKRGVPVRSSYTRQPKLQIPILWSKGALRSSSGARRPTGVTGFFDILSELQAKLELEPFYRVRKVNLVNPLTSTQVGDFDSEFRV